MNIYQRITEALSGASKGLLKVKREKARYDRIPYAEKGTDTTRMAGVFGEKIKKLTKAVPQKIDREITRDSQEHRMIRFKSWDDRMKRKDRYWKPKKNSK